METSSIAGASLLARSSQTQQAMSTTMMKKAAEQQNQMANILAQNAKAAPQPVKDSSYGFSTYA